METSARRLRILIVDDCGHCSTTLDRVIKMLGHEARPAPNGAVAVDVGTEFRPDVVLVDIGLPETDGYEVARRIRDQPWGTDVMLVALTAFGQGIDERRFHEAGFDHLFAKPVDADALIKLIGRPLPPPA